MRTEFSVYSQQLNLAGFASSLQGGRPENQDDLGFLDTPLGFLFVLCDGMGGGPGGKTASEIVKREIAASINSCNSLTPPDQALREAFFRANEAIEKKIEENDSLKGMGSTAVALIIGKQSAFIAHAGDSRFYLLRNGELIWRTTDHSLVSELVQMKALTEEQARISPQSNVITRGLGATDNHTPEITEIDYEAGDRFVLCSDGVWGMFPAKELILKMSQNGNIDATVKTLQDEIDSLGERQGGEHDNHSIAIIDVKEYSQTKITMIKKLRKIIALLSTICCVFFALNVASLIKLRNIKENINSNEALKEHAQDTYNQADDNKETHHDEKKEWYESEIQRLRKDSINHESTIRELRTKCNSRKDDKSTHSEGKDSSEQDKENITEKCREMTSSIDNIINCQKKEEKEAVNYIEQEYEKVIGLLENINNGIDASGLKEQEANNARGIVEIIRCKIKHNKADRCKVMKTGDVFIPINKALQIAKELRNDVEKLKIDCNVTN